MTNDAKDTLAALNDLTAYQPRSFVPEGADLTDPATVTALYQRLLDRRIDSADLFNKWILDRSELSAVVDQAGSILYVRMTCQTDDEGRAAAYQAFVENVEPAIKPLSNELDRRYLELAERFPLDDDRYGVLTRHTRASVELFRPDNVPLQTQVSLLSQEYQKVCGAMTVEFEGDSYTLPQMRKFLLDPDRDTRESAFRAVAERRSQDRDKLEDIFDRMRELRGQIAANAGFDNFTDYQFRRYHRFDYTPAECFDYHDAVERLVVPLQQKIQDKRRREMGLAKLRPWDTAVDPQGRPPLKPFDTVEEFVAAAGRIFAKLDDRLSGMFSQLASAGLLDLASRKGKAPGGYQTSLEEARLPFIFMNAVGLDSDVRTLLHESGHAFHSLSARTEPLVSYRHAPMEFCEVASMAMELLAGDHLGEFYPDEEDYVRSRREHLEGVASILPWVATIDAFQHWLYAHPDHTPQDRRDAWLAVHERFGAGVDWSGLEEMRGYVWHRQLHIFEVPFYYIEYGIAQLGALGVWVRARTEGVEAALAGYKQALSLGGSRPLPELFAAAGLKFDFSADTIGPLAEQLEAELDRMGGL